MASPSPSMLIIACPECGTRYRLDRDTVGGGRLVQCANCETAWQAEPPALETLSLADAADMFTESEESELDRAFHEAEQEAEAAPETVASDVGEQEPVEPAIMRQRLEAFSRREDGVRRRLPTGRMRHTLRMAAFGILAAIVGFGVAFRTDIVRQIPDLAGVYAMLGIEVNVVGLEFRDVGTVRALSEGVDTLTVHSRIAATSPASVPPVVVTLLDAAGAAIYEWQVTPPSRQLAAGETMPFTTRLTQPPDGAVGVRLSFSSGRMLQNTVVNLPIGPEPAH